MERLCSVAVNRVELSGCLTERRCNPEKCEKQDTASCVKKPVVRSRLLRDAEDAAKDATNATFGEKLCGQ